MKTPDYLSYERYKKKKETNPNKRLLIFVTTFFVTLLLFSIVAKSLSPDVDVTIGDESQTDVKENGLGVKRFIDERLKMIQMEDRSPGVSMQNFKTDEQKAEERDFYEQPQTTEEKINLPNKNGKTTSQLEDNQDIPVYNTPPRPSSKDLSTPFETPRMSKVYVGRYATLEQARVAQEILIDSGIDVSPFVKDIGGVYTLQIGSYSSRAKAEELASELRRNNFPARVIQE